MIKGETSGDYNKDKDLVKAALMADNGFNKRQAEIIEYAAYERYHSHWDDYLIYYDEFAELCAKVIEAAY